MSIPHHDSQSTPATTAPIGTHELGFVVRFAVQHGVQNTDSLTDLMHNSHSLLFFPKGTFVRAPGLLPFRMGTFTVAAHNVCEPGIDLI